MITWYMFASAPSQQTPDINTPFDIEHIYARKRTEMTPLSDSKLLESLGNKSLLERKINIRASDYRFEDKKKYYLGTEKKEGTKVEELKELTALSDFTEADIVARNNKIIDMFVEYLRAENLLA